MIALVIASIRLYSRLIYTTLYIINQLHAYLGDFTSIITRLSVGEAFLMIKLNRFSLSVNILIFNILSMIFLRPCWTSMAVSQASARPIFSVPRTDLTIMWELMKEKSIMEALLSLSAMKIMNPTFEDPELLSLNDPSEYMIISIDCSPHFSYLRPISEYLLRFLIKTLASLMNPFWKESFVTFESIFTPEKISSLVHMIHMRRCFMVWKSSNDFFLSNSFSSDV